MNTETTLWTQVLLQAIWDLAGVRVNMPLRYVPLSQKSPREWLCSRDESLGSFVWICHCLALNPETVRRRVLSKPPPESTPLSAPEVIESLSQTIAFRENEKLPLSGVAPLDRNTRPVFFMLDLKNTASDASAI